MIEDGSIRILTPEGVLEIYEPDDVIMRPCDDGTTEIVIIETGVIHRAALRQMH